jgi:hypothetical protein
VRLIWGAGTQPIHDPWNVVSYLSGYQSPGGETVWGSECQFLNHGGNAMAMLFKRAHLTAG